jgi:coenzyme F420-reducing hydrogenase gamma subunit
MMSHCGTLAKLASLRSSYLLAMAKLALIGCQHCETECRNAEKHVPCKACATCAAECKKIGA